MIANGLLALTWVGVTAYALLAGADFGGGFWDLVAGGSARGARQRDLIEHSIGPVWEANHVWLIFAIVVFWTGFPSAFAAIASSLYIPLTAAAFGIILRGSAFAFRKSVEDHALRRLFGTTFALSSVITPFFLGAVAGAVASARVPPGIAKAHPWSSWVNPTSVLGGALAVGVCAYLAAVYLTADARREGADDLAEAFRRRGLAAGVIVGAIALSGIEVLRHDAPHLYAGLTSRGLSLVVASAVFGGLSLVLLWQRRYGLVRVTAALAVVAVIWGWAAGQYPFILVPSLTIREAAAGHATLEALTISLAVGAVLFVPPLVWLLALVQRGTPPRHESIP
jgi:cytochrome d ubiquinol oxidase subunit II